LPLAVDERIEGMKEFFLRTLFAGDELHIVDQHQLRGAVAFAEFFQVSLAYGINELVGEFFTGQVDHAGVRTRAQPLLSDGLHQVGFAQAGTTVNKQGIVSHRLMTGDRTASGVSKLAVVTHHKTAEVELRIQSGNFKALFQWILVARENILRVLGNQIRGYAGG
jgi:hypothetical protein